MSTISALYLYPIKSCQGMKVNRSVIGAGGFENDRLFAVTDETSRVLTLREEPKLLRIEPTIGAADKSMTVSATGMEPLVFSLTDIFGEECGVAIHKDVERAIDVGEGAAEWFSEALGRRARLVNWVRRRPVGRVAEKTRPLAQSFVDSAPLHLISEDSLRGLSAYLGNKIPEACFRPNIVISGAGPIKEDWWTWAFVGDVLCKVFKETMRCRALDLDPRTGERLPYDLLRTLADFRASRGEKKERPRFGVYLAPTVLGSMAVGEEVSLAAWETPPSTEA